tara:strand:- start:546 stop:683 length:138 start_codon:yes stop_codon:yes gene_type:complete
MDKDLYDKHTRRLNAAEKMKKVNKSTYKKIMLSAPEIYKDAMKGA